MENIPTEHDEQVTIFQWAEAAKRQYPALDLLFAIPNGARTSTIMQAKKLKNEGLKKGVPDIMLPVPMNGYHGLFIELKRRKGGTVGEEQKQWLVALHKNGYKTAVCKGCDEAIDLLETYVSGDAVTDTN